MSLRSLSSQLRESIAGGNYSDLRSLTTSMRQSLSEAEAKPKKERKPRNLEPKQVKEPPAPVENAAEACLEAANLIRECLKYGDAYESAAADVAKYAIELAKAEDALGIKRGLKDVEGAAANFQAFLKSTGKTVDNTEKGAVDVKRAVDKLYVPFVKAKAIGERLAFAWGLEFKRAAAPRSAPSDIGAMSAQQLAFGIKAAAENLKGAVKKFLETGATAQKHLRNGAKKLGLEAQELSDDEKKTIVEAMLDFNEASKPLYGGAMGIARRVEELLARAQEAEKYEAKKALKIELEVESDPEYAGLDI